MKLKKALAVTLLSATFVPFGTAQQDQVHQTTLHRRWYFYAGGKYVAQGNSSIMEGAMYIERLTPQNVTQPFPLLVIHGHGEQKISLF
jgi:hypothetical protein